MPTTWNRVPLTDLEFIADSLKDSASLLTQVLLALRQAEIDHAWVPWTDATVAKVAAIKSFARQAFAEVDDQVTSKRFGRKCRAELEKERAAKEIKRRKDAKALAAAAAAAADAPAGVKKKVGRPRKTP